MPRPNKHNNLVDDNWGATEYADEYYENEDWQDSKEKAPLAKKAAPKPAESLPKPAQKVKDAAAKPKAVQTRNPTPPPSKPVEHVEPLLETCDNWEDAMDALEAHISAQEEKKAAANGK
jgi:hypothetical protein